MASASELRELALGLPGATEAPHFDRAAFKVARIFATLAADGLSANLKLSPDEQAMKCMLAPQTFSPVPNKWGHQGWTTVWLHLISIQELRAVLETAHAHAVSSGKTRRRTA